ncbi:zinc ribbon domain-containing protein [Actinoplanes regularis]|uniref:zinc ribbon domain-containing protein n=1 Tax=Actinoplanes regularis TaxID=52697 RepID=UPI0024A4B488|nr:zinc ribbon domain-containing protein [Actinoplanes regularis]GLW35229.1 hypothetical protein Areg01_81650 [Actinoplanes regularis]
MAEPVVAAVTATATCSVFAGTDPDGVPVAAVEVARRVGWLSALVAQMSTRLVAERWNRVSLAELATGVDATGRRLPSNGWMALRRLGWTATVPDGVRVSDRVKRIAEEHAARLLRLAVHRDTILRAIVDTWPADPRRRTDTEWTALWAALPATVTRVEVRNRSRHITAYRAEHGRLPASVSEAEQPPRVSGQILLAAADRQQVTIDRDPHQPNTVLLRVLLPAVEQPVSYRDWQWLTLPIRLPGHVPAHASVHVPTLRLVDGRVRADLPWRIPVPVALPVGHRRALGVDWGYNTLLTAVVARTGTDRSGRVRVLTDNRPIAFDATGACAKIQRLRTVREQIHKRLDHYRRLLDDHPDPHLQTKRDTLAAEHAHICARIRRLGQALAWAAARWAIDQALAAGCTAIYLEDLTSMEARGLGRTWNGRLSGHVRGQIIDSLRHLAAKYSLAVVDVPARGTSSGCPRCNRSLRHVAAPDRLTTRGHKWAYCPACQLSCDRDHAAAQRIAARGLLGQEHVARTRAGTNRTTRAIDTPVRAVRDKHHATPRRRSHPKTSRLTPSRRQVPAPATPVTGQRPAGRTPQTRYTGQVPTTKSTPRHPLGRPTSRGFHRHVTATPVTHTRRPVPRLNKS